MLQRSSLISRYEQKLTLRSNFRVGRFRRFLLKFVFIHRCHSSFLLHGMTFSALFCLTTPLHIFASPTFRFMVKRFRPFPLNPRLPIPSQLSFSHGQTFSALSVIPPGKKRATTLSAFLSYHEVFRLLPLLFRYLFAHFPLHGQTFSALSVIPPGKMGLRHFRPFCHTMRSSASFHYCSATFSPTFHFMVKRFRLFA